MNRILSRLFSQLRNSTLLSPDRRSDAELLSRFARDRDTPAFELLFWRHGAMVWNVCRRLLGPSADAEDAFQAVFVVLSQKASSIRRGEVFAGWLHRVAWRTALNVRKRRNRDFQREQPFAVGSDVPRNADPADFAAAVEQNEILDRELARLPEKFRLPLILCELESWPHAAAAAELKCPLGTLNSRLARGREKLRARLQRCGITFSGWGIVAMLPTTVSALSPLLFHAPAKSIQMLADATIRSMALVAVKKAVGALTICSVLLASTALVAIQVAGGFQEPPVAPTAPAPVASKDKPADAPNRFIDPNAGPLPEGAVARIGSNRLRHADEVTGLKYSPDGKWLASISTATADATARLWDAATGKQQLLIKVTREVSDHISPKDVCRALGFSRDGKQFLVIDTASLRAFDIASGKELFSHAFPQKEHLPAPKAKFGGKPIRRPWEGEIGAAISPDGKTYVLIQGEGLLEIRDVATGNVLKTAEHSFQRYVNVPIEFSPDSRHIVAGERDLEGQQLALPVIEVATGKTICRIEGSNLLLLTSLRFVPGTDKLIGLGTGATPRKSAVHLVNWKSGKSLGSFEVEYGSFVLAVAPDGKTLVRAGNGGYFSQIFDIDTGKEIARIPSSFSLKTLAFSPDGKLLAGSRAYSDAITVWDMTTHDYHPTAAEPVTFYGVRFGSDSNTLAMREDGHPLLDWRTGKILERLPESDDSRRWGATLSPNRQWFAKRESKEHSISVVDAKSGKEIRNFKGHTKFVSSLSLSRDGSRLASTSYDKTIRVWSLKTGNEIAQFTAPELTGHEAMSLSDNGRIMAVGVNQNLANGSGSVILIWDVEAKKHLARFEDETLFFSPVVVSPNGKWLAAGGGESQKQPSDETAVHIWETATGRQVHTLPGHNCKYIRPGAWCAFTPDSRWLVTGDGSGKLRIWEVLTGQEVRSFAGHHSTVMAEFSPDGKLLVAASDDAPCFIWDVLNASSKAKALTGAELQDCWNDLGKADAKAAFQAIGRLAGHPEMAVALIRKHLKPASVDPKKLETLLRDLDADQFAVRQAATVELSKMAYRIEPTLHQILTSTKSADARARLEQILKTLDKPSPQRIWENRALSVLEFIATPEASAFLDELAGGAKEDRLTQEAVETRERLRKRLNK